MSQILEPALHGCPGGIEEVVLSLSVAAAVCVWATNIGSSHEHSPVSSP